MMEEFDIEKLVLGLDFTSNHLVDCGNGLMLTNKEIDVLKRYGIGYKKCISLTEIIYQIEEILNEDEIQDCDDLEYISSSIAERNYYQNTNK